MNYTAKLATIGLAFASLYASAAPLPSVQKAVLSGRTPATQQVGFDLYIPVQHRDLLELDMQSLHDANSANYKKWLTPAQFNARYGATTKQVDAIKSQLAGFGLTATVVSGHRIHVTGSAGAVEQALGTTLKNGAYANGKTVVAATQSMTPPSSLVNVNAAVLGLSGRNHMTTNSHVAAQGAAVAEPDNRYGTHGGYWFTDLKQAYSFPSYLTYTGKGITIATLVDGAYIPADMAKYFAHESLKVPNFSEINVDGGAPVNADTFETNLDFQQAGGMAPDASIIHYNIPDLSDKSITDGLSQIIMDNRADIVSMSFGGPELFYTAEYNDGVDYTSILKLEDDLFAQGNMQGMTFIASSGDQGALGAPPVGCFDPTATASCGMMRPSASFPATSPHVTAVGGTNLATSYDGTTRNSTYVSEEAFADPLSSDIFFGTPATGAVWGSGGGDSIIFKKPIFQLLTATGNKKYRTIPDVSGHMGGCPGGAVSPCNSGDSFDYEVFNNLYYGVIGTSASAPDFAGLTALQLQRQGGVRMGNVNYYVYILALLQNLGLPYNVFRMNIPGDNGYYPTNPGYNRVLGNGTVNGVQFLQAPMNPVAGTPLTPTNP